jgi:hypothetical protein
VPPEQDSVSSKLHPLSFCLRMIFSENRHPLFRIMVQDLRCVPQALAAASEFPFAMSATPWAARRWDCCPTTASMTASYENGFAFPRRETPGGCFRTFPRRWREQGMPGARCTRGLVCKIVQRSAHEHTGSAEAIRHSLRNGFTAYGVLSPATNSSCHRRRRISGLADPVGSIKTSADLTPATGARTTRFCRPRTPSPSGLAGQCTPVKTFSKAGSAPFVLRASMIAHGKPALRSRRARRCRVHRIPSQRS